MEFVIFCSVQPYSDVVGQYPSGIMDMLKGLGLKHQGKLHSGIGLLTDGRTDLLIVLLID